MGILDSLSVSWRASPAAALVGAELKKALAPGLKYELRH